MIIVNYGIVTHRCKVVLHSSNRNVSEMYFNSTHNTIIQLNIRLLIQRGKFVFDNRTVSINCSCIIIINALAYSII